MFKPGDRVRYTGKSTVYNVKARIGQTGTVLPYSLGSDMVQVRWGEKRPPLADEGGVYPENIELIGLQIGDRVRYVGKSGTPPQPYSPDSEGTITGFADDTCGRPSATVRWDKGTPCPPCTPWLTNLEIITVKTIDTTKPIVLLTYGKNPQPVTLLGTTPEGHLLVDSSKTKKDSHWLIFNTEGRFVKSTTGGGTALTIENEAEKVTHRFDITVVDGVPYFAPLLASTGGDVQVVTQGDKVVSVTGKA